MTVCRSKTYEKRYSTQAYPAMADEGEDDRNPQTFKHQHENVSADRAVSKSCLEEAGSRNAQKKKPEWNLKRAMKKQERAQYECSSYEWYWWHKKQARNGGAKPRFPPEVIKSLADKALSEAMKLAEECGQFHGVEIQRTACQTSGFVPGRTFIVDNGASFNLIGRSFSTAAEKKTIRIGPPISLKTAGDPATSCEVVDLYVDELQSTFIFYVENRECQPVLSMGFLLKEEHDFSWKSINGIRAMRIKLSDDSAIECFVQDDVPRVRIAESTGGQHASSSNSGTSSSSTPPVVPRAETKKEEAEANKAPAKAKRGQKKIKPPVLPEVV